MIVQDGKNPYYGGISCNPDTFQSCKDGTYVAPENVEADNAVVFDPVSSVLKFNPVGKNHDLAVNKYLNRTGTDNLGNPVSEDVSPNSNGGLDYKRDTQGQDQTTGEPNVQRDQFSTDKDGTVTSSTTNIYKNSTINNIEGSPQSVVNNSTAAAPVTDDLAKEATLKKVETALGIPDGTDKTAYELHAGNDDSLMADLQKVVDDGNNVDKTLQNNPAASADIPHFWNYASGTCYPFEFSAGRFGTVSLESFCKIYDTHVRKLLVFLMGAWMVIHVFYFWADTVKSASTSSGT